MKINYKTCKHCGVIMAAHSITRYHNDNCKLRGDILTEEGRVQIKKDIEERWNSEHFQRVLNDPDYAEEFANTDPSMSLWRTQSFRNLPKILKPAYNKYYHSNKERMT